MLDFIFMNIGSWTISDYTMWLFLWFLVGLGIILIVMIFTGAMWYFFKIWSTKDKEAERTKINSSIRWMIFSWVGLLTIEIILLVIYVSFES